MSEQPGPRGGQQPAPKQPASPSITFSDALHQSRSAADTGGQGPSNENGVAGGKKKKHRNNRKRRNRRQSFAATGDDEDGAHQRPDIQVDVGRTQSDQPRFGDHTFYRLRSGRKSDDSLDSEQALLDHRDVPQQRSRQQSAHGALNSPSGDQSPRQIGTRYPKGNNSRSRLGQSFTLAEDEQDTYDDFSPLIKARQNTLGSSARRGDYGTSFSQGASGGPSARRRSRSSSQSSRPKSGRRNHDTIFERQPSTNSLPLYDVNNPPSRPGSPVREETLEEYEEVMLRDHATMHSRSPVDTRKSGGLRDMVIDIEQRSAEDTAGDGTSPSPPTRDRRPSMMPAEGDVCFPQEGMSELGEDDFSRISEMDPGRRRRRRRRGMWPDLSVLEDWSMIEKEQRDLDGGRARRMIHEPILIDGRLRPSNNAWHADEENFLRFTYFNEEFDNTMHASKLSELLHDGQSFRDLFVPEPPEIPDSESESDEEAPADDSTGRRVVSPGSAAPSGTRSIQESLRQESLRQETQSSSRPPSVLGKVTPPNAGEEPARAQSPSGTARSTTPVPMSNRRSSLRPKRYGPRPIWWLDVLCPTDAEIRVIGKAFGIHPLTQEDIVTQEPREKIEMFKHYYFMNYRTFEQDTNSENYLEPMNFYTVVFAEGVLSFHFSQSPHPANVRRRIRVLTDYLMPTSDWISYAIIDNITDVYVPLIQKVEDEVDSIDASILGMHDAPENATKSARRPRSKGKRKSWMSTWPINYFFPRSRERIAYERVDTDEHSGWRDEKADEQAGSEDSGDMLKRTGECRKKVMSLYRLLGNKADVIKGFAKRCNEQWDVAPRSEIGLYLGDIQDHIVTMTGNLSHYENLLSRAHSNYLAQINIRMNERAERTNDILGKLTVVGTIVLPMNIVTGLWGMNCIVPGQEVENLNWFWALSAFLVIYAIISYMVAKKVYGIV